MKKYLITTIILTVFAFFYAPQYCLASSTILHEFAGPTDDGSNPYGSLIQVNDTFYGMTRYGGESDFRGTIFSVQSNGDNYTVLRKLSFSDGVQPFGDLVASGNTLYGMAYGGGTFNFGTIFSISTDGSNFTILHEFDNGELPKGSLIISDDLLYGMTTGNSKIFSINTDGTNYTILHALTYNNGISPRGSLILANNVLYGMTYEGGSYDGGTIFSVNSDGSGFTVLYEFTSSSYGIDPLPSCPPYYCSFPNGSLLISGNKLYGMTPIGGTIFSINTNGTGFTTIKGGLDSPRGSLIKSGNILYGTTSSGGANNYGSVFSINIDGTGFSTLHEFSGGVNDGGEPYGSLILSGSKLYGLTRIGGDGDLGTIFSVSADTIAPSLSLTPLSPDPSSDNTPSFTGTVTDVSGTVNTVQYQVDSTNGSWTACSADDATFDEASEAFTCTVSPALTDGEHTIYIRSTDDSNNTSGNSADTFTIDTTAPIFSNRIISTTETSATITWNTSELTSTQLQYGSTDSYGKTTTETNTSPRVTSHSVSIDGLNKCTSYHYLIRGTDAVGNILTSSDSTFTTSGCPNISSSLFPQIPQGAVKAANGIFTPIVGSSVNSGKHGVQRISVIIEPYTLHHDAFFSSSVQEIPFTPLSLLGVSTSGILPNPMTSTTHDTAHLITYKLKSNTTTAGSPLTGQILGIQTNKTISWQIGNIHNIWYKAYAPGYKTDNAAKIIPELQAKPSIIALSYTDINLIPPGQPTKKFNTKNLKLAHSLDGISWKILPTSVVDPINHTVAALHKIGGYYMIVGR